MNKQKINNNDKGQKSIWNKHDEKNGKNEEN